MSSVERIVISIPGFERAVLLEGIPEYGFKARLHRQQQRSCFIAPITEAFLVLHCAKVLRPLNGSSISALRHTEHLPNGIWHSNGRLASQLGRDAMPHRIQGELVGSTARTRAKISIGIFHDIRAVDVLVGDQAGGVVSVKLDVSNPNRADDLVHRTD